MPRRSRLSALVAWCILAGCPAALWAQHLRPELPDFGHPSVGLSVGRMELHSALWVASGIDASAWLEQPIAPEAVLRLHIGRYRVRGEDPDRVIRARRIAAGVARAFPLPRNPRAYLSWELGLAAHKYEDRQAWRRSVYGGGAMQVPLGDSRLAFRGDMQGYLLTDEALLRVTAGLKYTF